MPLPRLHEAVVGGLTALLADGRVEADLGVDHGVLAQQAGVGEPHVGLLGARATEHPDQLNDGVRELEAHVVEGVLEVQVLVLGDEGGEGRNGEPVTLLHIKVDVANVNPGVQVAGLDLCAGGAVDHGALRGGHNDGVAQLLKAHGDLGLGVQHGHGGEGLPGGHGVEEGQGHVQVALQLGIVDEVLTGVPLANHLRQALPGLAAQLLPDEQEIRVQMVHDLVANDDGSRAHQQLANGVGPVGPQAGARGALLLLAHVAAELVARLVVAQHVVVNAGLDAGRGVVEVSVAELQKVAPVLLRAGKVAVAGDGEHASGAAAVRMGRLAGRNAGQLNHHIGEINQVRRLANVGFGVGVAKLHANHLVGQSLRRKGSVLAVARTPKSHDGVAVQEDTDTDAARTQLSSHTTRSRSEATARRRHFFYFRLTKGTFRVSSHNQVNLRRGKPPFFRGWGWARSCHAGVIFD